MRLTTEIYLVRHECKSYWHTSQSKVFNSLKDALDADKAEQIEWEEVDIEGQDLICDYIQIVDALNGEVLCEVSKFRR